MATLIPTEPWSMHWPQPERQALSARPDSEITRPPSTGWSILAHAPVLGAATSIAVGVGGLLGAGPRFLRDKPFVSLVLAVGGLGAILYNQLERLFLEQPSYDLEGYAGGLELRRYPRRWIAETYIDGSFDAAREEGFKRLAGYIFGRNFDERRLAMTTPVQLQRRKELGSGYVMTFTLPRGLTSSELPIPHDSRVLVREAGDARVAVLRTNGSYRAEHVQALMQELASRARMAGLSATGQPAFAAYDAPTTLPALRRLELWLPIP